MHYHCDLGTLDLYGVEIENGLKMAFSKSQDLGTFRGVEMEIGF